MPSPVAIVLGAVELTFIASGAVLLWKRVLSPAARGARAPSPLPVWEDPLSEFLQFTLLVVGCSFTLTVVALPLAKSLGLRGDAVTVFGGAAAQLGMLTGALLSSVTHKRVTDATSPTPPGVVVSGIGTFLIALPLVAITAKSSELIVQAAGLPLDKQDLIGMFARAGAGWQLAVMITLALIVAPLTEELVFRAGVFRYLRTRIPRSLALLLPALFFGALHVNWKTLSGLASLPPLVVLAVIFSLAYERTGRIGTPIVAHALFNLNTVLLVLSGVVT